MASLSTSVLASPVFTENRTYFGTTLAPPNFNTSTIFNFNGQNMSFEVTIIDMDGEDVLDTIISNVTFQLGRPDGTFFNYTTAAFNTTEGGTYTSPTVLNNTENTFYINFTQSMLGPAGQYNFTWFAINSTDSGNSTLSEFSVNKTSLLIQILLNGTPANRAYEKGVDTINVTAVANSTLGNLFRFMQISTNFTGVNASLAGNTSNSVNALYNTTNTAGMTLANYTVSANLSTTANQNHTFSQNNTIFIILRDTTAPVISGFTITPESANIESSITVTTDSITDHDTFTSTILFTKPNGQQVGSDYSSDSFTFTDTRAAGTYTVLLSSTDASGNSATAEGTFEITFKKSGSSGGSSGGPSASPRDIAAANIGASGATVTMARSADHGVLDIRIEVNNPVIGVQISVQKLDGKPATVAQEVSGTLFRYLEIAKSGTTDSNVKGATIRFSVDASWIMENSIDASTVALNRYSGGEWQRLSTRMVSSDGSTYTFEADTPGFSTFAITGDRLSVTPPVEEGGQVTEPTMTEETVTQPGAETDTYGLESDRMMWIVVPIAVAAGVAAVFYSIRKKRKHKK